MLLSSAAIAVALATLSWAQTPVAFTHVTVVDVVGGSAEPDMTVVVAGERIAAVAKSADAAPPVDARIVDARGKYLIPGLWDMHAHGVPQSIALYLVNGVTGVRSMNDDLDRIKATRDRIAAGELTGPRIYFCGPFVDGPQRPRPGAISVSTAEEGRQAVVTLKKRGVDFIKVYNDLSRESYFAIADEAKRQHLPFAGHVPRSVTAAEASDAGQKSIEHLSQVVLGCSRDEARLREQSLNRPQRVKTSEGTVLSGPPIPSDSYDPEKAKALFEKFAKNGTWHTPTFAALLVHSHWKDPRKLEDARLEYVPKALQEGWKNSPFSQLVSSIPASADPMLHKVFDLELQIANRMRQAGVGILAGTDSSIPYITQGFSLHRELEWLVKAGFSPLEALRSATLRPAEYFGITGSAGSIAKGKLADLVLLNADPLADISNAEKIEAVVAAGHYLSRATLDGMLAGLKAAAR